MFRHVSLWQKIPDNMSDFGGYWKEKIARWGAKINRNETYMWNTTTLRGLYTRMECYISWSGRKNICKLVSIQIYSRVRSINLKKEIETFGCWLCRFWQLENFGNKILRWVDFSRVTREKTTQWCKHWTQWYKMFNN